MHRYIIHNKLASLYVCFAMLHTTLHNETDIIHRMYHNISSEHSSRIPKTLEESGIHLEENNVRTQLEAQESERRIFDMIIPKLNEDILLWPKTENYVTIAYALTPSLSAAQRRAVPAVLRSIEEHTCIRFLAHPSPCGDDGGGGGGGAKLCFRAGRQRTAHLGRRPSGPQLVTLAAGDGPYWALHLVGHVLGLPHPHTCSHGPSSGQEHRRNSTRSGCASHVCPCRRLDPGSALQLTPEELGGWPPQPTSASALLALWRTRLAARLSHGDLLTLRRLYRCDERRPGCPRLRCRHGGFTTARCECVCAAGFGGVDCGVVTAGGEDDRVRHVTVGTELEVTPSAVSELGTAAAGSPCVLRVRTAAQRLRVAVRLEGAGDQLSAVPPDRSAALYTEALQCSIKMYAFQNGSFARMFCVLDYLGETLLLNVVSNVVDLLFSSDPSLVNTQKMLERTRLVERSAGESSSNLTSNATMAATYANTTTATMSATTAAPGGKGQTRSVGDTLASVNLMVLPPILFALMGLNILIVFCLKKYWECRYGTAGIYRGTEGGDWAEQDEEEPEDWQYKVEYSDESIQGTPMDREPSCPQAEMTDLELFRSMYGVPAQPPPDTAEEDPGTAPAKAEDVPSEQSQKSDGNLTLKVVSSTKVKKRVSFCDDAGKPLHVSSDASLQDGGGTPSSKRSLAQVSTRPPEPQHEVAVEEVHLFVPFTEDNAHSLSAAGGDTESDEGSEQSSCCDSSSSSSYHEDEDDPKEAEPGLLHGLTRCFRRIPDNEPSEI